MMKTYVHYSSKNKIKNVIQRVKRKDGYGWRMVKMDVVGDGAWYLEVATQWWYATILHYY